MSEPNQRMMDRRISRRADKLPSNGFIYLLHRVGEILGTDKDILFAADEVVGSLAKHIDAVDAVIDSSEQGNNVDEGLSLLPGLRDVFESIDRPVAASVSLSIHRIIDRYLVKMTQAFKEESCFLMKVNQGNFLSDHDLSAMQEKRNLDLMFYAEVYFELVSLSAKLRVQILKALRCFGLIDLTLDDLLDLDEDLSSRHYNILLIKLAEQMRSRGYPKVHGPIERIVREEGTMELVHHILLPAKNALAIGRLPDGLRCYLNTIINDRYSLLEKQIARGGKSSSSTSVDQHGLTRP